MRQSVVQPEAPSWLPDLTSGGAEEHQSRSRSSSDRTSPTSGPDLQRPTAATGHMAVRMAETKTSIGAARPMRRGRPGQFAPGPQTTPTRPPATQRWREVLAQVSGRF